MLNYVQPDIPTWGHQRPKRFLKAMRKILLRTEAKDYRITVLKPGYYKVGFTFVNDEHYVSHSELAVRRNAI